MASLTLPHNYTPRDYQLPFLRDMDSGTKRAVSVWHRRSGKDLTYINLMAKKMFQRVGTYYYYFPTQTLGRKILWDGMDQSGMPFLDHLPEELIANVNKQEMKILGGISFFAWTINLR